MNYTMKKNYVVTQSNNLIEAKHKRPLTAREQKIILTMVSMIQPEDKDFKVYDISVLEFHNMLGLEGRAHYTQIKESIENLMTKLIEIPTEDGWFLTHWITSAEYLEGAGTIRLKFVPELKPYLLQLKTAFTSYKLSNILSLKSVYAIRLYELMKKWQHLGKWECSLALLREKLGVSENTYPYYANFKAKVLRVALKELNDKTDLHVEFNEIRLIRKVVKIEFFIKRQYDKEIVLIPSNSEEMKDNDTTQEETIQLAVNAQTKDYKLDTKTFNDIYEKSYAMWKDQAENCLLTITRHVNTAQGIKNKIGYFRSLINTDFELYKSGQQVPLPSFDDGTERQQDLFNQMEQQGEMSKEMLDKFKDERFAMYQSLNLSEVEIQKRENRIYLTVK
jgi:plasmid replication initiation protein